VGHTLLNKHIFQNVAVLINSKKDIQDQQLTYPYVTISKYLKVIHKIPSLISENMTNSAEFVKQKGGKKVPSFIKQKVASSSAFFV
jgi:hypothetical protein